MGILSVAADTNKYWKKDKLYTIEEYFELEAKTPFKSEFNNGTIKPMAGGTTNHGTIIGNIYFHTRMAVKALRQKVRVYNSEIQIYIKAINSSTYPDGSIVVGESQKLKKNKAIMNPTIIFEVLSDSTGNYDRSEKFRKYKNLPSFVEYVLIEQDTPAVDVLHKKENGAWEMNSYFGLDDVMTLNTLDIKIALADLYEDTEDLVLPQYKMDLE